MRLWGCTHEMGLWSWLLLFVVPWLTKQLKVSCTGDAWLGFSGFVCQCTRNEHFWDVSISLFLYFTVNLRFVSCLTLISQPSIVVLGAITHADCWKFRNMDFLLRLFIHCVCRMAGPLKQHLSKQEAEQCRHRRVWNLHLPLASQMADLKISYKYLLRKQKKNLMSVCCRLHGEFRGNQQTFF